MKKLTPVLLALALLCACAPQGGRSSSGPAATPTPTPGKTFVFTRENFPRLDGSTATVPLGEAIASVLLGESRENVADLIHFSKTTGAYNALMAGEADLLVVAEAGEATYRVGRIVAGEGAVRYANDGELYGYAAGAEA